MKGKHPLKKKAGKGRNDKIVWKMRENLANIGLKACDQWHWGATCVITLAVTY